YGGHRGPGLSDIGQRLTQPELIIRINNGGYNMPSFAASLTAAELADMVKFLETRAGAIVGKESIASGDRGSK
ncbi:MAG: cytochrome c, partial [Planctomycetaceae bacterium]|nr:cytochrome c [Planctomycetaceae bacterium]